MTKRLVIAAGLLLALTHTQRVVGAGGALPVRSGRPVVASVGTDGIPLDRLVEQLGAAANRARLQQGRATAKDLEVLERLITIRLIVQEASKMGLDELPEIRKQIEVSSRGILRDVLFERLAKDVKPDRAAIEKRYRETVRQWKTIGVLFKDAAAAKKARKEIADGAPFDEVAARAIASKAATKDSDGAFHGRKDYLPQVASALAPLKAGDVSPVIQLQNGFIFVKVLAVRYPEDRAARAEARSIVVGTQQQELLKAHDEDLRRRYAVINKGVLKAVDYEAPKPGVDALLKDKRVVADIKGGTPLTVGELTDYLRMQFFHGTNLAKQRQEMNQKKEAALEATLGRRLLNLEAQRLGIDKSAEYRDRVTAFSDSLIFDAFVNKVIAPVSKMKEEEIKKHYTEHIKEFSYPQMVKARSLAFTGRAAAEAALKKLREGTDFAWLSSNAEGQVPKGTQGLVTMDGRPLTSDSMPQPLQKALASTKTGDVRLYASPEGFFYVISVQQLIPSSPRPYDEVREDLAKKLYAAKLQKGIEDYARKLRAHAKVQTFLKRA